VTNPGFANSILTSFGISGSVVATEGFGSVF